jgi:Family of unknown function (DUF5989)
VPPAAHPSFAREVWDFLRVRKKWWLGPIVLVLVLFGALVVLTQGTAIAPFIYTIFWCRLPQQRRDAPSASSADSVSRSGALSCSSR